jgi:3-oxoacyl-[acyl-carrier-protein] synthase-3
MNEKSNQLAESGKVRAVVVGTGCAVPDKILTSKDFEAIVDTTEEWIVQRTGIRERRICMPEETTGTLSLIASKMALEAAGVEGKDLDLIILGTVTGDYPWPATACILQDMLGATEAGAFDISAACAGFVYGMDIAAAHIESGRSKNVLVVGADTLTKQLDWTDRSSCILFGDGAGACVVQAHHNTDRGLVKSLLRSNGEGVDKIVLKRGGSKYPTNSPESCVASPYLFMAGRETYRFAVNAMGDACESVLAKAGMTHQDVDMFVPHQANLRIIESAATRLEIPPERLFVNVDRYGNTSGASIPIALHEAASQGRLKRGMVALTVGFGAGLVWGANLIRW